jgi:maltooligosyltrehalose trehalohydrolase
MWLRDYHADALRIDAIHAIFDGSAVHFLEQLAGEVAELEAHLGRRLTLIAESDLNDPRVVMPRECGGFGIDSQWSDDFHHALHTVLTGERNGYYADFGKMEHLAKVLRQAFVYDGMESAHRGRKHGRRPEGLPGWSFIGFLQNHDQVGNRANGERSSALMSLERARHFCISPIIAMKEWAPRFRKGVAENLRRSDGNLKTFPIRRIRRHFFGRNSIGARRKGTRCSNGIGS